MQNTDTEITLFSLSTCGHCKSVQSLLQDLQVAYEEVTVDRLEREDRRQAVQALKQYNPRLSFPTTVIGSTVVVGNKQDDIRNALKAVTD